MAPNPSNGSNLDQLVLKGISSYAMVTAISTLLSCLVTAQFPILTSDVQRLRDVAYCVGRTAASG